MRLGFSCFWLLALSATLALHSPAVAQQADAEPEGKQPAQSEPVTKETTQQKPWETRGSQNSSGPDIFLLPDKSGNLRKVLGFGYEDFLKAWQLQDREGKVAPPKYQLERLDVSGKANGSHADLQIELEILPRVSGWIEIPLELPTLTVKSWEVNESSDANYLDFDIKRGGYLLWLPCEPGKRKTLKLHGFSKLKLAQTNPSLELKLPHAAKSKLVFQVPIADAQFEVSPGIDLETTVVENVGTEARLTGHARPLRLQWTASEQEELSGNTVFEVAGQVAVQIDRRRAYYDAELKIDSFGKPLERLRVRLPVGAKLTGEQLSDAYHVVERSLDAKRGNVVELELSQPQSEPWTLRLSAEQPLLNNQNHNHSEGKEDATHQVTGFEVIDAFRQSGTLALHVGEQLQAYFDLQGDIEQTPNQETPQTLPSSIPMASFAYSRFPWSLKVHTLERQLRVSVTPDYKMQIREGEAELRLALDYQFAGAQTFTIRIDMRGWVLTDSPIEPKGAIDPDRIFEKPNGLLVLSLKNPNIQQLRLSLVARRTVSLGHNTIQLPAAQEAFVLPGRLTVEADPSLQVTPTIAATEGVSAVTASGETQSLNPNGDVLSLRTFLPRPSLSAELKLRERQVAVEVETRVDLSEQLLRIHQQLDYEVKYRPTSTLLLRIPEAMWEDKTLRVQLEGKNLPFSIGIFSEALPAGEVRQLRILLPRPLQNKFRLDFYYEVACPELPDETMVPLSLPLLAPDDKVLSNQVVVHGEASIRATLNQTAGEGPWLATTGSESVDTEKVSLQMEEGGKSTTVPLLLQIESEKDLELPTLERAWLQTWVVGDRQQIRTTFRFRTSQPAVFVQFPLNSRKPKIEVLLDGTLTDFVLDPNRRVAILVPDLEEQKQHTLEIRYQQEAKLASWGTMRLALPSLECRSTSPLVFWQLILPRGWHAVSTPDRLASESHLDWKQFRWGRQPTRYQPELENWVGATSVLPPPGSSNQYLYRGLSVPSEIEMMVVSHLWLVVTTSLLAFCLGIFLLHSSVAKRVPFWLLIALLLATLVLSYPEVALLAVQAIFWGGLMTLATFLLRKAFDEQIFPKKTGASASPSASTALTASWVQGPQGSPLHDEETETTSIQITGPVS